MYDVCLIHFAHRGRTRTQGHTGAVTSVAWSPDGQQLASGSYDKSIRVWDAESGKSVATLEVRCGGWAGWTGWMDGHC
jgi:WD40 repeat protein